MEYSFRVNKRTVAEPYFFEVSALRDGAGEIEGIIIGAMVLIIDPNIPPTISLEPLKSCSL
jgi:hypothetical protein